MHNIYNKYILMITCFSNLHVNYVHSIYKVNLHRFRIYFIFKIYRLRKTIFDTPYVTIDFMSYRGWKSRHILNITQNRLLISLVTLVFFVTSLGCLPEIFALFESIYVFVMYTKEQRVAAVDYITYYCIGHRDGNILVQIFVNAFEFLHVVITNLTMELLWGTNNVEVEQDTKVLRWCRENVISVHCKKTYA